MVFLIVLKRMLKSVKTLVISVVCFVDFLSLFCFFIVICSSLFHYFTQTRSQLIHNNNYKHNNVTQQQS